MLRTIVAAGALALGFATTPAVMTVGGAAAVVAVSMSAGVAEAQPAADRRTQPGSGSCRLRDGSRC
jgi:hypothetical protein